MLSYQLYEAATAIVLIKGEYFKTSLHTSVLAQDWRINMRKIMMILIILCLTITSSTVLSIEMTDYAAIWKAWGKEGQHAYFWGFIDGSSAVWLTAMDEYISSGRGTSKKCGEILDNATKKTATFFDENKLIDVMTNLYKDPANSYILLGDMVYIARDTLKGNDVSSAVLKARKKGIDTYELNKKMIGK
jgi:hypothetical protein